MMNHKPSLRRRLWRFVQWTFLVFCLLLLAGYLYLRAVAIMDPPAVTDTRSAQARRDSLGPYCYTLGRNWFRRSDSGLYELYVEGQPFERGVANGKLTRELVVKQEDAFNEQINQMVPSGAYRHFLKYVIGWFNRNLDENVTQEYKEEIYGVSLSASDQYNYIGSNYQRLMNYHAAHDIGHALQNMALVGCTSFGTWNSRSADSSLIVGRNFDFYVGDKFAEDKIVAFVRPTQGHAFMMITWGGMTGVVSGMNEKGLTVTLNAAKSDLPAGSATPISLLGREILQYAQNIQEALSIARQRKTFVSESILIGSAQDNKAVVIEKTPEETSLYQSGQDYLICSNHYQSSALAGQPNNRLQLEESASLYRFQRVEELLQRAGPLTLPKAVALLRDQKGQRDADIGLGNEKAVNQLIAHHSVVFQPQKLLVSISTAPWQLGPYVTYDLRKIFALQGLPADQELRDTARDLPADTFLNSTDYQNFVYFRRIKEQLRRGASSGINIVTFVQSNPSYYHTYVLAGDYFFRRKEYEAAARYYETAKTKEIATIPERKYILAQIEQCQKRLKS
ncbi:MAG: peptidase C45 [Saprospiraceae bacterium]|nr:peptidase C45 [Saprospiraceae bacterium]